MDAALMRLTAPEVGAPWAGSRVDGIIGWDVIRRFDILMDYQKGEIVLGRPALLGTSGTPLQNLTWVGKPFVLLRTRNGATLHFTLDTGAQTSFLNASILRKTGAQTQIARSRVFGIAGTSGHTGRIIPSLTLSVAGRSMRLENVIVYGPTYSGLIGCDGILGSDIAQFGAIRIDATNGIFSVGD
jgi:hypothetical protein